MTVHDNAATDSTNLPQPGVGAVWAGRIISGIVIAFLLLDSSIKLVPLEIVTQTMRDLGWPETDSMAMTLGVICMVSTILYAFPRTSFLGAILLTGYMGGAIATHLRIDSPLFSHTLFGAYLGTMVWGGLYLRDPRLRALFDPSR